MKTVTDKVRHANKIRKFMAAVERVGVDKVSDKIGRGSFSSFECALDAQTRRQAPAIIANFLADAQERCEKFCNLQSEEDVYGVLASLK